MKMVIDEPYNDSMLVWLDGISAIKHFGEFALTNKMLGLL